MAVSRTTRWLVIAGIIGFLAYVTFGSMARVKRACELCITFNSQTQCRSGAGATDKEAMSAARTTACGVMAAGMAQVIECENTQPQSVRCAKS